MIAVPGELLSVETISGCMEHDLISRFITKVALTEIAPNVKSVPGLSSTAYVDLIRERFSNPRIIDTTRRVAFDGSSRHPGFVLPSIRNGLAAGTPIDGLALVEAAWAHMCAGTREDGSTIAPNDPNWADLQRRALAARENPAEWIRMQEIYGDLAQDSRFATTFGNWLTLIRTDGLEAALARYLN